MLVRSETLKIDTTHLRKIKRKTVAGASEALVRGGGAMMVKKKGHCGFIPLNAVTGCGHNFSPLTPDKADLPK